LLILVLVIFDSLAICFICRTFSFRIRCRCRFAGLILMPRIIFILTSFLLTSFMINIALITNRLDLRFSLKNSFYLFIDVVYDVPFSCQDHLYHAQVFIISTFFFNFLFSFQSLLFHKMLIIRCFLSKILTLLVSSTIFIY
jgi:hypothetical protein